MKPDPRADGIDASKKTIVRLDDGLTLLTAVLQAIGVEELTMDADHHFHTLNEENVPSAHIVGYFCDAVAKMHSEIIPSKEENK